MGAPVKTVGKAQSKASSRITIAFPDELLEWADLMAASRRLERNDVIRSALAVGLLVMQAETIELTERGRRLADAQADAYSERVGGVEGFKKKVHAAIDRDAAEVVSRG
jgi:hypothetical protein